MDHARGNEPCVTSERGRLMAKFRRSSTYGKESTTCADPQRFCWKGDHGVWWEDEPDGTRGPVIVTRKKETMLAFAVLRERCAYARTLH